MVEITVLEVHLDGSEFTANAPFSRGDDSDDESGVIPFGDDDESVEPSDDGGSSLLPAVVVLVGLAVVALAVRRVLGGSGEPVLED
ncbi:MAG: hypothetical protein ABEI39_04565 [Halobacteriales archaeon]